MQRQVYYVALVVVTIDMDADDLTRHGEDNKTTVTTTTSNTQPKFSDDNDGWMRAGSSMISALASCKVLSYVQR